MTNIEEGLWLKKVMTKVNTSLNDISYRQIIRKLTNGIEQINLTKRTTHILIDSHVHQKSIPATIQVVECDDHDTTPRFNHKDRDNPPTVTFDGISWIRQDDGKWCIPDPNNMTTTAYVQKCQANTAQSDSGANQIVTDSLDLLIKTIMIDPLPMGGCNKNDEAAITCTAMGQLPIQAKDGSILYATAYYSAEVDGTIISPTTLVKQHTELYSGWMQHADCDNKSGYITLIGRNGCDKEFKTTCVNDLWYHDSSSIGTHNNARINKLNSAARYELWHQRTAHAGESALANLHKHVTGVPPLQGNAFYRCPSCMSGKLSTKRAIGKGQHKPKIPRPSIDTPADTDDDIHLPHAQPGQHFHIDFGFVRGSDFNYKNNKGSTITSIDGMNSYLAIVDRATRYTWIFTTASKHPPIEAAKMVLTKFKSTNPHRTVRVDQGGELGRSDSFKTLIADHDYVLEPTGSDASAQNGIVERPNRTFGQMMRCLLHSAELGPEFWTYALQHAVYIKNRLPHASIKNTPFEQFTGTKPDLRNFKIFGSRVYAKRPGRRPFKLDHHTASGYFLGYTATNKNVLYIDELSGRVKTATHIIFDEAHMSNRKGTAPLAAQTLQRLGYYSRETWIDDVVNLQDNNNVNFLIKQLTSTSTIPSRSTDGSIGYDISFDSSGPIILQPGQLLAFSTGIAVKCPMGTYARIAPRSGLTLNHNVHTMAGVIDPDFRGEIKVLLHNFGVRPQQIDPSQKIAQLILEQAYTPDVDIVHELNETSRGHNGFGSTDIVAPPTSPAIPVVPPTAPCTVPIPPRRSDHAPIAEKSLVSDVTFEIVSKLPATPITSPIHSDNWSRYQQDLTTAAAAAMLHRDITATFESPYDIQLSGDPFDNRTHRTIDIRPNDHDPLLGMKLEFCTEKQLPILRDCAKGSSAIRVLRWRSELRHSYITHINDIPVKTIDEVKSLIKKATDMKEVQLKVGYATVERQAMHPQYGIPQLYHDQLNFIGQHLWDIKNNPEWQLNTDEELVITDADSPKMRTLLANTRKKLNRHHLHTTMSAFPLSYKVKMLKKNRKQKLTRRKLLARPDWNDWKQSEFKQLNQYESQGTFGQPCKYPKGETSCPFFGHISLKIVVQKRPDASAMVLPNKKVVLPLVTHTLVA